MGSHFQSLLLPGDRAEELRELLIDWYERKGFPLSREPPLFEGASDSERGLILATNDKWTIVLASHREELERLRWELQKRVDPWSRSGC